LICMEGGRGIRRKDKPLINKDSAHEKEESKLSCLLKRLL